MKKRIILILAAIVTLTVSCQKESAQNETPASGKYTYTFAIASEQPGVRSTLDGNQILWEAGDLVGIFAGASVNVSAPVASDLSTLSLTLENPLAAGDVMQAYFPYAAGVTDATAAAVQIPVAQTVESGQYDADAMPVAILPVNITEAIAAGEQTALLSFYNLGAILRFHIYSSDPAKTGKVQSVSFSADSNLAGNATFDITGDPAAGALTGLDAAGVTTTLDVPVTVGTDAQTTAAQVPMVVAPGTYKGSIVITMEDATTYTYDIVNTFSVERSALKPVGVNLARAKSGAIEGSGTEDDPYIVHNATDLAAKMAESGKFIKLGSNILVDDSWTSENFDGVLDGDGNAIGGLQVCFVNALSGTVKNVRFTDVAISDYKSSDNCKGVVAQTASNATISGIAAYGEMSTSSTNGTSNYSGVGGVVGRASGATTISDCYIEVDIPIVGGSYGVGGILGNIRETDNITISNCTYAGTISGGGNYTQVGGILGRKTNINQASKDLITNCLVSGNIAITGTGSNMIGGIFGALQGSTISGDYVGGLTIKQCAFTGSVSAGTAVGGVCGVGCSVSDSFVSGKVQATNNSGTTGGSAGIVSAAKGDVTRCVIAGSRISGTNLSAFSTAGIISKQNGNTPSAIKCAVIDALLQNEGKTILGATTSLNGSDNKWWNVKYLDETAYVSGNTVQDGDAFAAAPKQSDFETLGYDFTSVWKWNSAGYPELQNVGCNESVK